MYTIKRNDEKKTKTKKKDVRWFRASFLEIVEKIWTKRHGKRSVVVCVGGTPYYAKAAMLKTFLPDSFNLQIVADLGGGSLELSFLKKNCVILLLMPRGGNFIGMSKMVPNSQNTNYSHNPWD